MLKKAILMVLMIGIISAIALAQPDLIIVKYDGQKYLCHPSSYQAYDVSKINNEENVWYCLPTKPIHDFAQAGVFGNFNTLIEIETKIIEVDPNLEDNMHGDTSGKVKWF